MRSTPECHTNWRATRAQHAHAGQIHHHPRRAVSDSASAPWSRHEGNRLIKNAQAALSGCRAPGNAATPFPRSFAHAARSLGRNPRNVGVCQVAQSHRPQCRHVGSFHITANKAPSGGGLCAGRLAAPGHRRVEVELPAQVSPQDFKDSERLQRWQATKLHHQHRAVPDSTHALQAGNGLWAIPLSAL